MQLGMFSMPLHRPTRPWAQTLAEDQEAVVLADRLGYSEAWIGEHFSSTGEPITSPLVFLATVIAQTENIRFGTGVVNLSHRHPVAVAVEAAMFDQLSGGRLILGVGPGGLACDAELFGHEDMPERAMMMMEAVGLIRRLWTEEAPFEMDGRYWQLKLDSKVWKEFGIGQLPRPMQQPHPPIAMAMVAPGGRTAQTVADEDFIPISANFVPAADVHAQWQTYAARRDDNGQPVDPTVWRVCRNLLVTDSRARAEEMVADPDGVFAFYFRYLRAVRRIPELKEHHAASPAVLDPILGVAEAIDDCVIAGTAEDVLARLVDLVDLLGPFGTLLAVGHDWDDKAVWTGSMRALSEDVMPKLSQHAATKKVA